MPLLLQSRSQQNTIVEKPAEASPATKRRAVRCLFGPADDQAQQSAWVHSRLDAIAEAEQRKWNFDFDADMPLSPVDGRTSEWEWKAVGVENLPSFYSPRTIATKARVQPIDSIKACSSATHCPTAAKSVRSSQKLLASSSKSGRYTNQSPVQPSSSIKNYLCTRKRSLTVLSETKVDGQQDGMTPSRPMKPRRKRLLLDAGDMSPPAAATDESSNSEL